QPLHRSPQRRPGGKGVPAQRAQRAGGRAGVGPALRRATRGGAVIRQPHATSAPPHLVGRAAGRPQLVHDEFSTTRPYACRAIYSSSLVGTTMTVTLDSGEEMMVASVFPPAL